MIFHKPCETACERTLSRRTTLATEILSTIATTRIRVSGDGDSSREAKRPVHPIFPTKSKFLLKLRTIANNSILHGLSHQVIATDEAEAYYQYMDLASLLTL